ncbi:flavin reductase family protein [Parafrankia sp. BMG5.11]|uniref:flavin reductase family protein n=1 Tax=Parafrankia sp. BMG5.11 TaxID=222540 RepID=UPI00103AED4F|nr:flavin reductase family protein [Parafrankia sp. BMG5.11]TCJ36996.1 flavin reductase [Parafrankia sp. BMG5.11]
MTFDRASFRSALGSFPTGVTVVTTLDAEEKPVGVTASSFNSVSLDPPLVLWSLARSAHSNEAFCSSGHFAIHVLSANQEDVSNRFARGGEDKFSGMAWRSGEMGSPVLNTFAALFECRTLHQYEGGDHVILVGEVVSFEQREHPPLVFHGGRYAETRDRGAAGDRETVDIQHGIFSDEFLFYLISRAHFQTSRRAREMHEALGLSQSEYLTLAVLSMDETPASSEEVVRRLEHTGYAPDAATLHDMVGRALLIRSAAGFELAPKGRELHIRTLAVAKGFEDDLLGMLTPGEVFEAKRLLRRIIELTGEDVPLGWRPAAKAD